MGNNLEGLVPRNQSPWGLNPTSISWAIALLSPCGPLPYFIHIHFVGHCPTTVHFVGHCPTSVVIVGHCPTTTYIDSSFSFVVRLVLPTFVLRGCDSISLVPYVPGPILATICRGANSARNRLARFAP